MPRITIIFDNNKYDKTLQEGFGFSCFLEFGDKKILFDTGGNRDAFSNNIEKLNIDLKQITHVVLSHKHFDHLAGFEEILTKVASNTPIFLPDFFPENLTQKIPNNLNTIIVKSFLEVSEDIFLLTLKGEYNSKEIYEQSMILDTPKGLVVITGCAHPGIIKILNAIQEKFPNKDIYFVMGGFHFYKSWFWTSAKAVRQFKKLKVGKVAPCHCTGDTASKQFQKQYRENFIKIGAGVVIEI